MNVPNALSILRLLMVPLFLAAFFSDLQNAYFIAALIFVLAGITDFIDGYLARKYNMTTVLGKLLDPLADKMMVLAALVALMLRGFIPQWAAILYFVKELLQGVGGLFIYLKIKDVPPSNMIGKVATTIFYASIAAILIFGDMPQMLKMGLLIFAMALILFAMAAYAKRGVRMLIDFNAQSKESR